MRKFMVAFIAFLVIALPINGAFTNTADAASTRVAVIKELKGTVKVKKAGGSKEFTAFAKMSLNEGDVLSVGTGGSAVLQFANGTSEDDKMSVSANTRLSFSKLSSKKGTTTKVSMWSGNAWVDVKSIASVNDEFTLETPTAVMGVRGTHFFVNVNPLTGATNMTVAAGIVRTSPNGNATTGKQPTQNVYPAQQVLISPTQQGQAEMLKGPIDIQQIVSQSGPEIIKAFLLSAQDIVAENKSLMDTYLSQSSAGESPQEIERVRGNIENLVGAVASNVEKQSKLRELQDLIAELERLLGRDVSGLDLSLSGVDNALLSKINDRLNTLQKQAEERQRQEQLAREKDLQAALREKQENQKKAAEEAIKKNQNKAYEQYESQLDELEKKRLRGERDKRLEENNAATPSTTTSGGNGSSGNPGPSPSESSQAGTLTSLRIIKYVGEASPPAEPPPSSTTIDLSPTFNSSTTNYTAQAASNVSYVYIRPVAADTSDTLTVNGSVVASGGYSVGIPLNNGNNVITIVVTASGGTTKTYTVSINRTGNGRLAYVSGLELKEPFDPDVFEYEADAMLDYIIASPDNGSSVTVKLNGANVSPSGSPTRFVPPYEVGANVLEVTVTPELGGPVKYTFNVMNRSVVRFSGLVSTRFLFDSIDSNTYSGVLPSEFSEFDLTIDAYNPDSKVELLKDDEKIGEGTFHALTGLTEGWNVYQIRISDKHGRVLPELYTLQIWRGDAAWINDWNIKDDQERSGQVDQTGIRNWEIRYVPGASSLKVKPILEADIPFTIHSIVHTYGLTTTTISVPDPSGYYEVPVNGGTTADGKLWLENDGKLVAINLSFVSEPSTSKPSGISLWRTSMLLTDGQIGQLLWTDHSEGSSKRYYTVLPNNVAFVNFHATLMAGAEGKINADPFASDDVSLSIFSLDPSGYTTFTLTTQIGSDSEETYTFTIVSPSSSTPELALSQIRGEYVNEFSSPRVPEATASSDGAYYIMAEQLPDDGTLELAAFGSESNRYEWTIGGVTKEQNEESEDHVEATPSGLEAYHVKVTDPIGRSAIYTVYVYQGLPDAGGNFVNWDSIDKQWVMEAYLDLDGNWSTTFDLRLLPDISANFVNTSGITYDPETMTLSGQYSEEDEVYVDISIPIDSGMTATYRLKINLYPSS